MIKTWLRHILWKLCGRDYLVLHPGWAVVQRHPDYTLIGTNPAASARRLPVLYNYHTANPWQLRYFLRSDLSGTLRYQLGVPGKGVFCEITLPAKLPMEWTVELNGPNLIANGQPLALLPGKTIPRDTPWLVGSFTFTTETEGIWSRRTGHRVQGGSGDDADYFTGRVYENYESQAASFPKQILESLRRYRPLSGRLLDVGCATGLLVEEALRAGLDVEGIDVSSWAVERANARVPGRCRVLDLDQASAADFTATYDFVALHSVIEHLADPGRALGLLFQLVRPGGLVYIQTLNADSLMHRMLEKDWSGYTDYTHKSPWLSADWLDRNAREAGFEIMHLRRYGVWNDNGFDDVWKAFAALIQIHPAGVLLEDQWGDFVELILRRPGESAQGPPLMPAGN